MHVATRPGRVRVLLSAALLLAVCALFAPTTAASAAATAPCNSNPYGCTTTSSPPPAAPVSCTLSVNIGGPGALVTLTCTAVAPGTALQVVLDGHTVFHGATRAVPADLRPAAAGAAQPFDGAGRVSVTTTKGSYVRFRVPDLAPGAYHVFVATSSSNEALGTFRLTALTARPVGGGNSGVSPLGVGLLVLAAIITMAAAKRYLGSRRRAH
ncbi:MAG TPA: hypothetical protein VHA73_09745 [Acidimicrobiales bacterium]|jgi:hypothetical protein|nr:hypothetical protein [Acidimicrobiales bacterium]